ncbi:hypothetical protein G6725_01125 [Polynucleobacter paneuropaeus]|jgi:hypothetical protein|nr:hypothetical protein [Polynucleobacter paneuropaeus]
MKMPQFDDAKSLIEHSQSKFSNIQDEYAASLSKKNIDSSLLIGIKNFMENLRSALDFSAHGLFEAYGASSKSNPKIYFPYAALSQSFEEFRRKNYIEGGIPGISTSRPDVVSRIESYQHFSSIENKWLPLFMELNNENKHQQLTPQEKRESKRLNITYGGTGISLEEGASISLGSGASIQMSGMIIPGGQTISTNSPAKIIGPGQQVVITWSAFYFSSNAEPVVPFLENALSRVNNIVNELSSI